MASDDTKHGRLAELRKAQTVLEAQKAELLRELNIIEASIKRNSIEAAGFAPIYTLPDDVLVEIFAIAYEHVPLDRRCAIESNPMIPTQVCQRWRQTALALPRLWSCLHVSRSANLLTLWLGRSALLPLHIVCTGKDVDTERSSSNTTTLQSPSWTRTYLQALTILLEHSSRWQHFDIDTGHSVFLQTVLEAIGRKHFPVLKYLAIWHAGHAENVPNAVVLPDCPRLAELATLRITTSFTPPTSVHHLRELYLGCRKLSNHELVELSNAAPNLVEISMDEVQDHGVEGLFRTALFPHLKTLTFLLMDWEDLFDWFDAPALETLTCDKGPIWSDPQSSRAVHPPRVYPALRTVRLPRGMHQPWPNDGHFFRKTPNVEHLDLVGCTGSFRGIIEGLASLENTEGVLPALRTITITEVDPEYHDILLELVDRRMRSERPLKELRLGNELYAALEPRIMDSLNQKVKVVGLEVPGEEAVTPGEQVEERTSGAAYW